jgi:hypothetical protein
VRNTRFPVVGWSLLVALVALGGAGCGQSQLVSSAPTTVAGAAAPVDGTSLTTGSAPERAQLPARSVDTPTTARRPGAATPTSAPATPRTPIALQAVVPGVAALGSEWVDEGDPGSSLDLTDPPAPCTPYLAVLHHASEDVLREFSFQVSPDGQGERGHLNFAAFRAPAPTVTVELAAVAQPSYASCAEASAERRFRETEAGTIDAVTAGRIALPVAGAPVIWRATVAFHDAGGKGTMSMDVGFLAANDVFVKLRVAACGCRPLVAGNAELLPGETGALRSIAQAFNPVTSG